MRQKITYTLLAIASLALVFAEMKIGYIDSNRIMTEYDQVRQIQAELEKEQRKIEAEFNDLLVQLDSLKQDFERQRLLMSENRREEKKNEILRAEAEAQEFQLKKVGPEGEIYRKQAQLLNPILEDINKIISNIGAEKGYDYILDAVSGSIVYAIDSHDLTDAVLEQLKGTTEED
ncbi:MAG: OmpH family outer membrane protein [Candidatus Marinimicrobia bacterium]|nr:OmpH family outer membrane protein [Candidatus Neomarinimicrobiota bacterium]MBL7023384.1 OmpH family outer membrane protein [Candidatus Neomarinimicrobiota bacterium]MBL7109735.1 OmpH family outer membrane protein [Candidatus Neomarinimicrobiota bacterium]